MYPNVFLKAAKRIESAQNTFSCCAIADASRYRSKELRFYIKLFKPADSSGACWLFGPSDQLEYNSRDMKYIRIMLLYIAYHKAKELTKKKPRKEKNL